MATDFQEPPVQADQRKALRAPLIALKVQVDDGRRTFFGYAKNISRSGLFIAATNPRPAGSRFPLEIELPAPVGRSIRADCEVIWERSYSRKSAYEPGMGLKFLDLPEEDARAIDAWITSCSD